MRPRQASSRLGVLTLALLLASGCGIIQVGKPTDPSAASSGEDTGTGGEDKDKKKKPSEAASEDEEKEMLAKADCSKFKPPTPGKKGIFPLIPHDVPCAAKAKSKLHVAVSCPTFKPDPNNSIRGPEAGPYLQPGDAVEAIGIGSRPDQWGLAQEVKIKAPDGSEVNAQSSCFTFAPVGIVLVPKAKPKGDGSAELTALMKQLFEAGYQAASDVNDIAKKHEYKSTSPEDRDYYEANHRGEIYAFCKKHLHNLVHGSNRTETQVLSDGDLKWLAEWPDLFTTAYADGLKDPAKQRMVPAVETLNMIGGVGTIASTYNDIRFEEENLERKLADVPENKRASQKEKTLAEIAQRKKDTDQKIKDWLDKVKKRKADVKF